MAISSGDFTHELVEACTDPDTSSGFRLNDGNELCDVGKEHTVRLPGLKHEVNLALYWSELKRDYVAPTTYSLRVALGKRASDSVRSVGSLIQGASIRDFVLRGCNP